MKKFMIKMVVLSILSVALSANAAILSSGQITVTASSEYIPQTPASNTVDLSGMNGSNHNNTYTDMWLSKVDAASGAHLIQWEFEKTYHLDQMTIWNYNQISVTSRGIRHCTIEYSFDGTNWTTLYEDYEIDEADGSISYYDADNIVDLKDVAARWVRLTVHPITAGSDSGHWGYSSAQVGLSEVRFETSREAVAPAIASYGNNRNSPSHQGENTVDGSGITGSNHDNDHLNMYLSSVDATSGALWIWWEFEKDYTLADMTVWNYNQSGVQTRGIRHCTIEYSLDGSIWTTLYADYELAKAPGSTTPATDVIDLQDIHARWVKVTAHDITVGSDSGNWGYASAQIGLSEVQFTAIPYVPPQGTLIIIK